MAQAETRFGKYALIRRIATGGMAEIHLARQEGMAGFAREVVIKRIHKHLTTDPEFVGMFLDEARLVAKLSHPNIVSVHEFGQEAGSHFLVMEYVEGDPLSAAIKRSRGISPEHALRIVSEVCAGLHYAHSLRDDSGKSLGIVHRDVSPQNVLLGYDGSVKLIDFGIAKTSKQSQQTKAGSFKGKYAYMSPEQARGRVADLRSDVHAVGIVLWEMLTGRSLFYRDSVFQTMSVVLSMTPPSVRDRVPRLDPRIDDIIAKALAKDADQRYQSCADLQVAVDELAGDLGLHSSSVALGRYVRNLFGVKTPLPGALSNEGEDLDVDLIGVASGSALQPVSLLGGPDLLDRVSTRPDLLADGAIDKVSTRPDNLASLDKASTRPDNEPVRGSDTPPPALHRASTSPVKRADPATPAPGELPDLFDTGGADVAAGWEDLPETIRVESPIDRKARGAGSVAEAVAAARARATPPRVSAAPPRSSSAAPSRAGSRRLLAIGLALGVVTVVAGLAAMIVPRARASRQRQQIVVTPIDTGAKALPFSGEAGPGPGPAREGPAEDPAEGPEKQDPGEGSGEDLVGAFVSIHSTPAGALVLIDGRSAGERTVVRDLPLDPGEHLIELTLEGYRGWRKTVTAQPGERLQVRATLKAEGSAAGEDGGARGPAEVDAGSGEDYGMLSVDTVPPSRVFSQGRELGSTPLHDVELPAGSTLLTFQLANGHRFQRAVQVRPGRTTRQRFDFLTQAEGGGDGGEPPQAPSGDAAGSGGSP